MKAWAKPYLVPRWTHPSFLAPFRLKKRKNLKAAGRLTLDYILPSVPSVSATDPLFSHTEASQSPSPLLNLAPELLTEILTHVGPRDILNFSAVCVRFHSVVKGSVELNYRVELAAAGLDDNHNFARLAIGDRLRLLQSREAGWRSFEYRNRVHLDMGPQAYRPCYDLHDGLFLVGRRSSRNVPISQLSWFELPSVELGLRLSPTAEGPSWHRADLDVSIDDFALDLQQELLVLVETLIMGSNGIMVHFRSFPSLLAHPNARQPLLVMECQPLRHSTIVIDVCGKHVGLLFNSDHTTLNNNDALIVWDWTTGETRCLMHAMQSKFSSFMFLSENTFIVPDVGDRSIGIYTRELSSGKLCNNFGTACHLSLPPQDVDSKLYTANCRYKSRGLFKPRSRSNSLLIPPNERSFFLSRENELIVVSLEYRLDVPGFSGHNYHFFELITPKSTCLHYAALHPPLLDMSSSYRPGWSVKIPWEHWGPRRTRMLRMPLRLWDYFFSGMRYVTQTVVEPQEEPDEGRARILLGERAPIRILDFNPRSLARLSRRSSSEDTASAIDESAAVSEIDEELSRSATRSIRIVRSASVVAKGQVFSADVYTNLPYLETTTLSAFPMSNLMCDHERIIGLKTNANLDMVSMDVFLL